VGIDIRLPIGLVFALIGILMTAFGAASSGAIYQRSLGVNVNLYWGLVLLAFGLVMVVLGRRRKTE
jgi:predicted MFS family arabinose efflux permease